MSADNANLPVQQCSTVSLNISVSNDFSWHLYHFHGFLELDLVFQTSVLRLSSQCSSHCLEIKYTVDIYIPGQEIDIDKFWQFNLANSPGVYRSRSQIENIHSGFGCCRRVGIWSPSYPSKVQCCRGELARLSFVRMLGVTYLFRLASKQSYDPICVQMKIENVHPQLGSDCRCFVVWKPSSIGYCPGCHWNLAFPNWPLSSATQVRVLCDPGHRQSRTGNLCKAPWKWDLIDAWKVEVPLQLFPCRDPLGVGLSLR